MIRVLDFQLFQNHGEIPRSPSCDNLCTPLSKIDRSNSVLIFISHCWLRGWPGAGGYDGRPHPDDAQHNKHKLCVEGILKIFRKLAPLMEKAYVWIDFACINQDVDPAKEIIGKLPIILAACDCIFTPIVGRATIPRSYYNLFEAYDTEDWHHPIFGYNSRCWCRLEMFYAANVPLSCDNTRLSKFDHGMKQKLSAGIRPHFLFGMREKERDKSPYQLPPLKNTYFEDYNPINGSISSEADRSVIRILVEELLPYMSKVVHGYKGERNSAGQRHGRGTMVYRDGGIYEGEWVHDHKHGRGKDLYPSGEVYVGDFVDGVKRGKGVFTNPDGSRYEGDFLNGMKHGHGCYHYVDGSIFEGSYVENEQNGHGVIHYADGSRYEGEFVDHKRHGPSARFTHSDGRVFIGTFCNDEMDPSSNHEN